MMPQGPLFILLVLVLLPSSVAEWVIDRGDQTRNPVIGPLTEHPGEWSLPVNPSAPEASLLVVHDSIFHSSYAGDLTSVSLRTGEMNWRRSDLPKITSGIAYLGGALHIGSENGRILAISLVDGHIEWEFQLNTSIKQILSAGSDLYITKDDAVVKLTNGGIEWEIYAKNLAQSLAPAMNATFVSNDTTLRSISANGSENWRIDLGSTIVDVPLPIGGIVVTSLRNGTVLAMSGQTGNRLWHYDSGCLNRGIAGNNNLIFLTCIPLEDFGHALIAVDMSGQELWRRPLQHAVFPPVAIQRKVTVADSSKVFQFDAQGNQVGQAELTGFALGAPLVVGTHVVVEHSGIGFHLESAALTEGYNSTSLTGVLLLFALVILARCTPK